MVYRPKVVKSRLSEAQARAVLHTVKFPSFQDAGSYSTAPLPPSNLATLSRLHVHFLFTFPFEALSMNYEPNACMDATIDHIYRRFVEKRTGGGYCLQVNLLYREMLAFLGFRFIGVLGRVYSRISDDWSGLTHTASLVYLRSHLPEDDGKKVYYHTDVGFGSSPHRPILLRDKWQEFGRGTDKFRLLKAPVQPGSTLEEASDSDSDPDTQVSTVSKGQMVWILQNLKNGEPDWEDCYSFCITECFDSDYQASNRATSHSTSTPFATMILVVRYLIDPELLKESNAKVQVDGLEKDLYPYHPSCVEQRMVVGDKHIVKLGDEQTVLRTIASEKERVELLKKDFGLLLHVSTQDAVKEINNKPSALNKV
ncbi:uncharacterized protein MEPE_02023 [Melanopsichium pennsylvanicum]|uniref:Arylamine N-acetyltransferase n=2 Tax=Melanopsichium pennsylvanicum TaxID=63383 RepID=A0AAJ4XJX6_9BASI|nr:conserved hypothetical protein [Melanopsichium pennsylvanicum 4]SNX83316.1 uncharacterized protein MEPE_02023 [Melanopsichium pennsylvanicum]